MELVRESKAQIKMRKIEILSTMILVIRFLYSECLVKVAFNIDESVTGVGIDLSDSSQNCVLNIGVVLNTRAVIKCQQPSVCFVVGH